MHISNVILLVFGVIGLILLIIGCILIPVLPKVLHDKIEKGVQLRNGTDAFDNWVQAPVPVFRYFWVFNVLNPDDIVNKGAKPHVEEQGPYVYRELSHRTDIRFADDSHVIYRQPKSYVFQRHLSKGPESDTFISVDIPILTLTTDMQYQNEILQTIVKYLLALAGRTLFVNHTVGDYLWGYNDSTLANLNSDCSWCHFPNYKFGLFYIPSSSNGSDDGVYDIFTGVKDVHRLGHINSWKGQKSLSYWTSKACNKINGTDASIFPPFASKKDRLYVFSSDICRSIYADFEAETSIKGINAYRYVPPPMVFADNHTNPDNAGFCTPAGNCMHSGVLNISVCQPFNAPIVMSQPHFYEGPFYRAAIDGMHPSKNLHQTFIDLEPNTGVVVNVSKRLQINVHIKQLDAWEDTKNFNSTVFPIVWLSESAELDDVDAKKMKKQIFSPIRLAKVTEYTLIGIGAAMLLIALIVFVIIKRLGRRDDDDDERLLVPDAE